jgi:uncharacterized glyoxalase superfamily protein PhnB
MLYLEFIDWQEYIAYLGDHGKVTHLDVIDASSPGQYEFHLVATQPVIEHGVLALSSALIVIRDEPADMDGRQRKQFNLALTREIDAKRDAVTALFKKAGIRIRAGIYSIEPPPVLRLRTR